jgi:serine/threonine-protein kinase
MAYEMFTGELPWGSETTVEFTRARTGRTEIELDGVATEVSPAMAKLIRRALATDPVDRFSSAAELSRALVEAMPESSTTLDRARPTPSSSRGAYPVPPKRSLAVLPFRNRGGPDDDYLADGITEDLIDGLCELSALRVLSHGAVMRFRDDNREAHEIGAVLNVETVINGSIRRSSGGVRLTARAITVADGYQVWSKRFDVRPEDLLSVSDEVVAALSPTLAGDDEVIPRAEAIPSEAMELYLKARTAYRQMSDNQRATDLFEEAHAIAPDSALINAGLAMTLMRRWMVKPTDDEHLVERGRAAAERAIAAAPQLGEPHLALGYLYLHTADPIRALGEFRIAIARAPSLADAHGILGALLSEMGRGSEARRRLMLARELDPTLTGPYAELKRSAALSRDWKRLDEYIEASPPSGGFDWMFAIRLAAFRDSTDELESTVEQVAKLPDDPYNARNIALVLADGYLKRASLHEALAGLPVDDHAGVSARRLAFAHQLRAEVAAHHGGIKEALDELEAADRAGLIDVLWLDRCPLLAAVREEPRFQAVRDGVQDRAFAAYDAMRTG